jgi:hypothetical protein
VAFQGRGVGSRELHRQLVSGIAKTAYRSTAPGGFQYQKNPTEYKKIQKYDCIKGKRYAKIGCRHDQAMEL